MNTNVFDAEDTAMASLTKALEGMDPSRRAVAEGVVTELNFMRRELVRLRKDISEHGSVEHFVNGRQEMDRLRPSFQAYQALVGRYGSLCRQLVALMPEGATEQGDDLDAFLRELRD